MKVSLNCLLEYIKPTDMALPADWDRFHDLLEDIGLEVKRVELQDCGDIVFTLELLANRGDHHCYLGLAREIHMRTAWPLVKPVTKTLPLASVEPLARVTSDACLAYTLSEYCLKGEQKELGAHAAQMIELSGTNIIAPAVDVTNFVNIEVGQPMHVFDADKIVGAIEVRRARAGEKALLLGASEPVTLPDNTLVIADEEKVLAVAGVMGCETSKPTLESRRLYLESGTFDPVSVRKAARALGVQSLSSARFERGADPNLAVNAVHRANELLESLGWSAVTGLGVCKACDLKPAVIELHIEGLNHYFATTYTAHEITPIFERMGSPLVQNKSEVLHVEVPSHRLWDLVTEADLFEEFARTIGYNTLPSKLPVSAGGARPSVAQRRLEEVEATLVSEGFYEIFTDSFYSDQDVARLGMPEEHPLMAHVRINNSETKAYSLLKNNNIVQALAGIESNVRIKNQQMKAFERNKRFLPNEDAVNGLCDELQTIWGMVVGESKQSDWQNKGQVVDIFYLKGIIDRISQRLGLQIKITPKVENDKSHPYLDVLHPMRRAALEVYNGTGWQVCGILGEVHPSVVKSFGLKALRPYFFEIEQSILTQLPQETTYNAPSSILPVKRDLCFGLYQQQCAGYIADWVLDSSSWLDSVEITDLFEPECDGEELVRAIPFSLMLNPLKAGNEVFSGSEMNYEIERLADGVVAQFGADKVKRR
jgi:phenylalanyl-tRNA synthetase beta chain